MRLGDRKSVTDSDYAHRRLIDESTRRGVPPGSVDFMAVNNSNRRDGSRADRLQFNTLWDKRTGDENGLLLNFLFTFRSLIGRGVGKHCSGKHTGRDENCSAGRYQRLHKLTYLRRCGAQIIETMTMVPSTKAREAMAVATTSPRTKPKFRAQNFFVRRP